MLCLQNRITQPDKVLRIGDELNLRLQGHRRDCTN
jgi:hypothetical protein